MISTESRHLLNTKGVLITLFYYKLIDTHIVQIKLFLIFLVIFYTASNVTSQNNHSKWNMMASVAFLF